MNERFVEIIDYHIQCLPKNSGDTLWCFAQLTLSVSAKWRFEHVAVTVTELTRAGHANNVRLHVLVWELEI